MSFGDTFKKFARDANEFVMGDHDSPSLAARAQKANVSIRDTLDGFDYDDVQQWGLGHINAFVDSLHPDISGFLAREVTKLENMLLDSLEGHVVSVFSTTFGERKPGDLFKNKGKLEEFDQTSSDSEQERAERRERLAAHDARKKDRGPTTYGQTGHAFRNALVPAGQEKKAHSGLKGFKQWLDDHGKDKFEHIKDKMESRFDVIEDRVENHAEKFGNALEKVKDAAVEKLAELLGKIVKALKGVMNNIREKAIELVHFLRDVISKLLTELNRGLAEAFTTAALTCLKVFLRENTELEDIQRAATKLSTKVTTKVQHGVTKLVGGVQELFSGHGEEKEKEKPREMKADKGPSSIEGAIAAVLSGKLSQGYALVRAETREEFRTILSALETMLLAQLPDTLRSPLARLLDGDPLSVGDQKDEKGHPLRELFSDIVENIEEIARDILMAIKNKIFAVAAGSYEVLERVAWAYTQEKTVEKMRQYLPSLNVENLDKDVLQMEPPKHPVAAPAQPA